MDIGQTVLVIGTYAVTFAGGMTFWSWKLERAVRNHNIQGVAPRVSVAPPPVVDMGLPEVCGKCGHRMSTGHEVRKVGGHPALCYVITPRPLAVHQDDAVPEAPPPGEADAVVGDAPSCSQCRHRVWWHWATERYPDEAPPHFGPPYPCHSPGCMCSDFVHPEVSIQ